METFPLPIPEGVVVEPYDGTPVHIWSNEPVAASPSALFVVTENSAALATTRFHDLFLTGGKVGIQMSSSLHLMNAVIRNVQFQANTVGFSAIANSGGSIDLAVRHCKIAFGPIDPNTVQPPTPMLQKIGFQFHALQNGGFAPGIIQVEVLNPRTIGTAPPTVPEVWYGTSDLAAPEYSISGGSRLIDIFAKGENNPEHSGTGAIAEVKANIVNGDLDGKFDGQNGWDIGIYSAVSSTPPSFVFDYVAGYDIQVNGTKIHDCKLAGVYATSMTDARGHVDFQGAEIYRTGGTTSSPVNPPLHNGIHGYVVEGYLAFTGTALDTHHNVGSGLLANSGGTILSIDAKWPTGLYLGFRDSQFHNNQVGMTLAGPKALVDGTQGGIVGGTWDYQLGSRSLVRDGAKPFDIDYGQGFADRCTFYDNVHEGIEILLDNGPTAPDIASMRFVNCIAWNQPDGAFRATANNPVDAYLLTPILHSTFADNGWNSGYTMEVERNGGGSNSLRFEFNLDPSSKENAKMKILNSIFQREVISSADEDLGEQLRELAMVDQNVPLTKIGVAGVRLEYHLPISNFDTSTESPTPFAYLGNPTLVGAFRYFLDPLGADISEFADSTPQSYSITSETESNIDFTAFKARVDRNSGLRDKGAHEVK